MYKTPILLSVVVMAIFHCGLVMSFESLLPGMSTKLLSAVGNGTDFLQFLTQLLNESGAGFSILMMAVGAGALGAAMILAGIRSDIIKGRLFFAFGAVSGLSSLALGISPNLLTALPSAMILGFSSAAFMTLTHTMIQTIVPDGVRGRVAAIYSVHIGGMMASFNLLNGIFADYIGAHLVLIVTGLAFVLVVAVSWQFMTMRVIYRGGVARFAQAAG